MDEQLLLMDEQRKRFLEMESSPGQDTVKTLEMATKDLENYINLVDKAAAGCERTDSNFERNSTVGKMQSSSITATEKLFVRGGVNRWGKHHCRHISRTCRGPPSPQQPSPSSVSCHQH